MEKNTTTHDAPASDLDEKIELPEFVEHPYSHKCPCEICVETFLAVCL